MPTPNTAAARDYLLDILHRRIGDEANEVKRQADAIARGECPYEKSAWLRFREEADRG